MRGIAAFEPGLKKSLGQNELMLSHVKRARKRT